MNSPLVNLVVKNQKISSRKSANAQNPTPKLLFSMNAALESLTVPQPSGLSGTVMLMSACALEMIMLRRTEDASVRDPLLSSAMLADAQTLRLFNTTMISSLSVAVKETRLCSTRPATAPTLVRSLLKITFASAQTTRSYSHQRKIHLAEKFAVASRTLSWTLFLNIASAQFIPLFTMM